jgi:hypothetical protein
LLAALAWFAASTRQIAQEEGVSREQVRQDIRKAGDKGLSPEPEGSRVTGQDGKSYPTSNSNGRAAGARREAPSTEQGCSVDKPALDLLGLRVPEAMRPFNWQLVAS